MTPASATLRDGSGVGVPTGVGRGVRVGLGVSVIEMGCDVGADEDDVGVG